MPKKILQPIIYRDTWHRELSIYFIKKFFTHIFEPLLEAANERLENSKETILERYLKDGKIQYKDGKFSGQLSASISKEIKALGGKFERGQWSLPMHKMPFVLKRAIDYNMRSMEVMGRNLTTKLEAMTGRTSVFVKNMTIKSLGVENLDRVSKEFKKTVRNKLAVQPELDARGLEKISKDYLTTIELPIRKNLLSEFEDRSKAVLEDFSQEIVEKLRDDIQELILGGAPRQKLRDAIKKHLNISNERCKFIARQETALLTVKFKKSQYEQYGINKYKWHTVGDHKVRERHVELNNETIDWSDPPIVDEKTGRRAHAGEDFRCRCQAVPIVEW